MEMEHKSALSGSGPRLIFSDPPVGTQNVTGVSAQAYLFRGHSTVSKFSIHTSNLVIFFQEFLLSKIFP